MNGGEEMEDEEGEWLPVLRTEYNDARNRHAKIRADAYEIAREDVLRTGLATPELWMSDIEPHALEVWRQTWRGVHPSGAGSWNWPTLVEMLPRRAAVLPMAIWDGADLCGLAIGHASKRRMNLSRHTVSLTFVERRPEPPPVKFRGQIAAIAITAATRYGEFVGARRLRLLNPDRKLLVRYEELGFRTVWEGSIPIYCERKVLG